MYGDCQDVSVFAALSSSVSDEIICLALRTLTKKEIHDGVCTGPVNK
jgi:hypothetical protein